MTTFNTFNTYDVTPSGRLSLKKLVQFAADLNKNLAENGAKSFIEIGARYNYYAVDELSKAQYDYRINVGGASNSGVMRTYKSGLTAKQCLERAREFYYESLDEATKQD